MWRRAGLVLAALGAGAAQAEEPEVTPVDPAIVTGARSDDAAVVLGFGDYERLPDVPFAREDAASVRDVLVSTRGLAPERVYVLGDRAGQRAIRRHVAAAAREAGPDGVVFLYFRGWGALRPADGERLLLPASADPAHVDRDGVALGALYDVALEHAGRVVAIVDAAFDDGPVAGLHPGGAPLRARPPQVAELLATERAGPVGVIPSARHGAFTWAFLVAARLDPGTGEPVRLADVVRIAIRGLDYCGWPGWNGNLGDLTLTAGGPLAPLDDGYAWGFDCRPPPPPPPEGRFAELALVEEIIHPHSLPLALEPARAAEHRAVLAAGASHPLYDESLFRIASDHVRWMIWANDEDARRQHRDTALALLLELLERGDRHVHAAVESVAFSFVFPPIWGRAPVAEADAWLRDAGPQRWEVHMWWELAEFEQEYGDHAGRAAVYTHVLGEPRYALDPALPWMDAELLPLLRWDIEAADPVAFAARKSEALARYVPGSAWREANAGRPDALAVADQVYAWCAETP